ncbi:MAG: ribonuclease Z [Bacteroidales bacterium]|nr:ribonuclease Z [Bacteroidales bacterium]
MDFSVLVLGSGAATPKKDRHCASQVVNINGLRMLMDCGEATQHMIRATHQKMQSFGNIFISHLHGDHIFGLPGLLSSMHLCGRTEVVRIVSPKGLKEAMDALFRVSDTQPLFPIEYVELEGDAPVEVLRNNKCVVTAFPLHHSVPCYGYRFEENFPLLNIRRTTIDRYPSLTPGEIASIKQGNDYVDSDGNLVPNAELTHPRPIPKRYAYCCDTVYSESILPFIQDVDLLCVESTFADEFASVAAEKLHCTASQAALLAKKANAKKLLLTHFSARYKDITPLIEESTAVFPNTIAAEDGLRIEI